MQPPIGAFCNKCTSQSGLTRDLTCAGRSHYAIYHHRPKITSVMFNSPNNNESDHVNQPSPIQTVFDTIKSKTTKSTQFSILMTICGASLGPFLDSYHSLFGVLTYDTPLGFPLLGSVDGITPDLLTCVTTYWVPPLFGLAGFIIGWLYILFDTLKLGQDAKLDTTSDKLNPSVPKLLIGISYFTFQYWLS